MTDRTVAGVLLAGGQSRRMGGGDKVFRKLGGRPILDHVLARLRTQVNPLLLNANGDPSRFADTGLPVAADLVPGFAGPLAGVLTGMDWAAREAPQAIWLASFACDAPFLPLDLVARLKAATEAAGADLACAKSRGRSHPVFGLWKIALLADLRQGVMEEEIRKVDRWTSRHALIEVDFPDETLPSGPVDPFFNTNRPDDLEAAEAALSPTA